MASLTAKTNGPPIVRNQACSSCICPCVLQWQAIECGGWPFHRLADQLCNDILSPVWVVRHGAAAGLRELLREHAAAAAVEAPLLDNTSGWASPGGAGGSPGGDPASGATCCVDMGSVQHAMLNLQTLPATSDGTLPLKTCAHLSSSVGPAAYSYPVCLSTECISGTLMWLVPACLGSISSRDLCITGKLMYCRQSAGLRRLGVVLPDMVDAAAAANAAWLEDVIEHLLCVLALDRFADYVSDQVRPAT